MHVNRTGHCMRSLFGTPWGHCASRLRRMGWEFQSLTNSSNSRNIFTTQKARIHLCILLSALNKPSKASPCKCRCTHKDTNYWFHTWTTSGMQGKTRKYSAHPAKVNPPVTLESLQLWPPWFNPLIDTKCAYNEQSYTLQLLQRSLIYCACMQCLMLKHTILPVEGP